MLEELTDIRVLRVTEVSGFEGDGFPLLDLRFQVGSERFLDYNNPAILCFFLRLFGETGIGVQGHAAF